jgi:hypothetical protein
MFFNVKLVGAGTINFVYIPGFEHNLKSSSGSFLVSLTVQCNVKTLCKYLQNKGKATLLD